MISFLMQCQPIRHIVCSLGYVSESKMRDIQLYSSCTTPCSATAYVIAAGALSRKEVGHV